MGKKRKAGEAEGTVEAGKFPVESGVEIPAKLRGSRGSKYPFRDLLVDESFFVGVEDAKPRAVMGAVASANRTLDARFITRTVRDESGEATGVRVWRTR